MMKIRQAKNYSVFSVQSLHSIRFTISLHLRWFQVQIKQPLKPDSDSRWTTIKRNRTNCSMKSQYKQIRN